MGPCRFTWQSRVDAAVTVLCCLSSMRCDAAKLTRFGLSESVDALLHAGADVHATSDSGQAHLLTCELSSRFLMSSEGVLPIHASAIGGHRYSLDLLVEARADPNAPHGFAGSTAM